MNQYENQYSSGIDSLHKIIVFLINTNTLTLIHAINTIVFNLFGGSVCDLVSVWFVDNSFGSFQMNYFCFHLVNFDKKWRDDTYGYFYLFFFKRDLSNVDVMQVYYIHHSDNVTIIRVYYCINRSMSDKSKYSV